MSNEEKTLQAMNVIQAAAIALDALNDSPYVKRARFSLQSALQELFAGMQPKLEEVADAG